ncbi:MAG: hypothetical protein ACI9UT_002865 [Flavobacteriales bacterium]|jgi:hypothetical protein
MNLAHYHRLHYKIKIGSKSAIQSQNSPSRLFQTQSPLIQESSEVNLRIGAFYL